MFVYGIRCAPADLSYLPESATADYYIDYGLLIFPHYTRAGCISAETASGSGLTPSFWNAVKLLVEDPTRPHRVAHCAGNASLSEGEAVVLQEIQRAFPMTEAAWYNVPKVATATQAQGASAEDC
jgi:hypothetical protein